MTFPELLDTALAGTPDARRLLREASLDGLRWLAGRPLARPEPLIEVSPAGAETRAEIPQAAAARLQDILERRPDTLAEWLQLVCSRRLRVPPILLPELLELGASRSVAERELIVEAGGVRMVWLAKLNPAWVFAAYADAEEQFRWGTREDRLLALRRIRRQEPARGRDLLRAAWQSDRGEDRASLLTALSNGLSLDDEDLLTEALGDRHREVRETALRLLRRLPDSRWSARWIERTASVVRLSATGLIVREVTDPDPAWVTDGLEARRPADTVIQQVLALTPPRVWPAEMLDHISRHDFRVPLMAGLAEAAAVYRDTTWCRRLILAMSPEVDVRPLFLALPEAEATETFVELSPPKHHTTLVTVLREAPWRLDPHAITRIQACFNLDAAPLWLQPGLARLIDTLDYRLAMRRELESE